MKIKKRIKIGEPLVGEKEKEMISAIGEVLKTKKSHKAVNNILKNYILVCETKVGETFVYFDGEESIVAFYEEGKVKVLEDAEADAFCEDYVW